MYAIQRLQRGETITIKPQGNSMRGKIDSGDKVTIEPLIDQELLSGDIVLVTCNGNDYLHLIKAIKGNQFQIGNTRGNINGWVTRKSIYGKVIEITR